MSLKDINIKLSYETTEVSSYLVDNFYIPALETSKRYLRIAGFFSSSSLLIASEGISGLIKNDGKMQLLISPELNEKDRNIIINTNKLDESLDLFKDFDFDAFDYSDNLKALAWMLYNKKLEIKIVIPLNEARSLFHQKVGIFIDENEDMVSFSGSINETASAWLSNIEEFKTFKSWEYGQSDYLNSDLDRFYKYWNGEKEGVARIFDVPSPILDKIIKKKPNDIYDLGIMHKYIDKCNNDKNSISLFTHQKQAVDSWVNNNRRLLMEMATGTGKTRTAIACMDNALKLNEKLVVIVSTPQNTLSRQWIVETEKLNVKFAISNIIDGTNHKWKSELNKIFLNISIGMYQNAIIYTTHTLCCKKEFIDSVNSFKDDTKILFICDEAHGMGANVFRKGLLDCYDYRVGLSATPDRMWDEEGTELIKNYFGNKTFSFTLHDALHTINPLTNAPYLNNYIYNPVFVQLSSKELASYKYYSKQIAIEENQKVPDEDKINRLRISRANITKNAENKYEHYQYILDELKESGDIKDVITFVSPEQIDNVIEICNINKLTRAKITEDISASKIVDDEGNTERQYIIDKFKKQLIQVLIGIGCLDEGIDIPTARIAILMASSTNPREYVQRIGRVIRRNTGKKTSVIYDLIVLTDNDSINLKEAKRAMYIAENSDNYNEVRGEFIKNGVDVECL